MARRKPLTAAGRRRIKASNFALPGRRFPINTPARARNALARAAQHLGPKERRTVQNKVARRYPGIEVTKTKRRGR